VAAPFVAIVLAQERSASRWKVAGLSLAERGQRVAAQLGAREIFEVRDDTDRERLRAWRPSAGRLLVLRVTDQLVHPPLAKPLLEQEGDVVAVAPADAASDDLAEGQYAGAFVTTQVGATIAALADGGSDAALAAQMMDAGAVTRAHGAIARAPVTDAASQRRAETLLYRILNKPQDNAIARVLFRPISSPLTKLLAATPITPNQITTITVVLVALGLWIAASASPRNVLLGSLVILISSYVDCCDGEIARLKLRSSRLGAWYDTIVDEVSSLGYMLVLGWHCHLHFGARFWRGLTFDPWLAAMAVGAVTYVVSLYCIYYNIILVARSANSQDYVSRVEVAASPAGGWELRPVPQAATAAPAHWPRWLAVIANWLPNLVRRDFIVWASLLLVAVGASHLLFAGMVAGGALTAAIVFGDHVRLRGQLGELRDRLAY
jgi:phosphatidylglycerophosphate synthase